MVWRPPGLGPRARLRRHRVTVRVWHGVVPDAYRTTTTTSTMTLTVRLSLPGTLLVSSTTAVGHTEGLSDDVVLVYIALLYSYIGETSATPSSCVSRWDTAALKLGQLFSSTVTANQLGMLDFHTLRNS
eukprot:3491455-Rhodomonas_salina.3